MLRERSISLVVPATREAGSTLNLGGRAHGELALSEDDRSLFALRGSELQAWNINSATMPARFDACLPLRSISLAAPDTVVAGTDIGAPVPTRLIPHLS